MCYPVFCPNSVFCFSIMPGSSTKQPGSPEGGTENSVSPHNADLQESGEVSASNKTDQDGSTSQSPNPREEPVTMASLSKLIKELTDNAVSAALKSRKPPVVKRLAPKRKAVVPSGKAPKKSRGLNTDTTPSMPQASGQSEVPDASGEPHRGGDLHRDRDVSHTNAPPCDAWSPSPSGLGDGSTAMRMGSRCLYAPHDREGCYAVRTGEHRLTYHRDGGRRSSHPRALHDTHHNHPGPSFQEQACSSGSHRYRGLSEHSSYAALDPVSCNYLACATESDPEEDHELLDSVSQSGTFSHGGARTDTWILAQKHSYSKKPGSSHRSGHPDLHEHQEGEDRDRLEEDAAKQDPLFPLLLKKAKELFPKQIKIGPSSTRRDDAQGDWSSLTTTKEAEPQLSFARSGLVEGKIEKEFGRHKSDRCSRSHPTKSTPLRPAKCRMAKFNFDDGRPTAQAEPNLIHSLANRTTSKSDSTPAVKKLKTHEEIARKSLTALSQLDALKNLALVSMTRATEDGKGRAWASSSDPDLLMQILEGQHRTIDYLAELQAFLLADTVMDRRQATLTGSSIPQEIQKKLLESDPRKQGLWDEDIMERAKKDLESEALTRPFRRPTGDQKHRPSLGQHRDRRNSWGKKSPTLSGRQKSTTYQASSRPQPRSGQSFGAPSFSNNTGGLFPKENFRKGKSGFKRK